MEKNDKFLLVFYILLGTGVIFGLYSIDSSLEKPSAPLNLAPIPLSNISITKIVDIETEKIYAILSDVENYPRVLPKNILSINKIEEANSSLVYEITVIEKGIKSTLLIKQDFFPFKKQILTVIDGDAKHTIITQKFQNQGNSTKLTTDVEIELSGILTGFGFLPQLNVHHAMNTILSSFIEYSVEKTQNEKIVDDIYRDILKRPADQEGLTYFTSLLEQNKITPEEIKMYLYDSEEYNSSFLLSDLKNLDELSNEAKNIINELYEIILRRNADPEGLQYFGSLLESEKFSKSDIRDELLKSSEFASLPVDTRSLDIISKENQNMINFTHYELFDKYAEKKTIRAFGIFLESGTMSIDEIREFLSDKFND
jgi:ribosome-associated toxin RatA of RatAB toxin-antitoxin module